MGPVRIRHSSHDFGWQSSYSVDLAGWQAKMASIEIWIPWRNAHKPIGQHRHRNVIGIKRSGSGKVWTISAKVASLICCWKGRQEQLVNSLPFCHQRWFVRMTNACIFVNSCCDKVYWLWRLRFSEIIFLFCTFPHQAPFTSWTTRCFTASRTTLCRGHFNEVSRKSLGWVSFVATIDYIITHVWWHHQTSTSPIRSLIGCAGPWSAMSGNELTGCCHFESHIKQSEYYCHGTLRWRLCS